MKAPIAPKIAHEITQHGHTRVDNYHWMRDKNWKNFISGDLTFDNDEVKKYIDAENTFKDEMMKDYKAVEKELYDSVLSRIKEDDESYPFKKGNYFYYSREEKGKNYSILCRKKDSLDAPEEIYFDINKEAAPHDLYMFGPAKTNKAQTHYAYFYNLTGSMERTLKVRNLETGEDSSWTFENSTGSFVWLDDENFYVVERDELSRGKNIYKMNIHDGPASKELVFSKPEKLKDMFMGLGLTNDEKYIVCSFASGATQVVYLSKKGSGEFKEFITGENDITYDLEHYNGEFYILTNDEAENYKIMKTNTSESSWSKENWKEFISECENTDLVSHTFYNHFLVLERKNKSRALNDLAVLDMETGDLNEITMPDAAYDLAFVGAYDHKDTLVRVDIDSPISPNKVLELDLKTCKLEQKHMKDVPNYDSSKYELKREFAKARDGELIPLTIVHKKGIKLDGSHKAFVYAYGSYGMAMPSYFSSSRFTMIDKGFVWVVAHIRGGSDKGNTWYLDGKMRKKMNTFTDFIDSCEYLIDTGYTSKGEIVANGGSAGGLLMGAISNLRPDLFKSVVADVAFVDMINTISDETLPLTPPEWEEWGNPIEDKGDFEYMMSYSPYDNVEAKDYPHTLYNSGISDEQVTYWEPTKMVAKLRELKTNDNMLLLNMKMHAGHAGASKKYEWIEEVAFKYAFILKSFDMK